MRLFISAGEPSGDLHGANLIGFLRKLAPGTGCHGFGGDRMRAAGCELIYPLCDLALVGVFKVLGSVPRFYRILNLADEHFRAHRPDAVVLIDYPGFHWWLARRAKAHGIPVLYFVPPQLWAWGGWRIRKMQRLVDHVLCTLPFEQPWYQSRGVAAHYIGHPYFDELRQQSLDPDFVAEQRSRPNPIIALLPGSRSQELDHNLATLQRAAALIHARRPETRFLVACLRPEHKARVEREWQGCPLPVEVHAGRTPEVIHLAHSCLAVSGSVGLELLYRGKPSVVFYRQHWSGILLARLLMRCRYISLVNLLADRELYPEFLAARCVAEPMADHVLHWLNHPPAHEALCGALKALREKVAEPGACERAAACILDVLRNGNQQRQQKVA
jgi:lipid-A-disaccharide synthase